MIEVGDIILLTRRRLDWNILRWLLSWLIYIFNGKFVHTALPYMDDDAMLIREMEWDGVRKNQTVESYIEQYGDRIHIMKLKHEFTDIETSTMNHACRLLSPRYEYIQFIWQVIKAIAGKFIGRKTPLKRNCSEDTARCFNIVRNLFNHPESITPNEVSKNSNFTIEKLT